MTDLKEGDRVKCIDGHFKEEITGPFRISEIQTPLEGKLYFVREVVETLYGAGIRLEGIQNDSYYFGNIRRKEEPIFRQNRFALQE